MSLLDKLYTNELLPQYTEADVEKAKNNEKEVTKKAERTRKISIIIAVCISALLIILAITRFSSAAHYNALADEARNKWHETYSTYYFHKISEYEDAQIKQYFIGGILSTLAFIVCIVGMVISYARYTAVVNSAHLKLLKLYVPKTNTYSSSTATENKPKFINCRYCSARIEEHATECPNCGAKNI